MPGWEEGSTGPRARLRGVAAALALVCVTSGAGGGRAQAPVQTAASKGVDPAAGFAVASVRPSQPGGQLAFDVTPEGFRARSTPLFWIILQAYSPLPTAYWRPGRVEQAPAWVRTEPFDIDARLDESEARIFAKLTAEQQAERARPWLQALLRERFGLRVHAGTSSAFVWELLATRQVRLSPPGAGGAPAGGIAIGDGATMTPASGGDGRHLMRFFGTSMPTFALVLSGLGDESDPPIVDRTRMQGRFDFVLVKRDGETEVPDGPAPPAATRWDLGALGLRLARGRADLPSVVVDEVHEPDEN